MYIYIYTYIDIHVDMFFLQKTKFTMQKRRRRMKLGSCPARLIMVTGFTSENKERAFEATKREMNPMR